MRINTNVSSLNAWRNLTSTDGAMGKNLERLSSGFRINRAGDDVAGLAISENMRAQIKGLNQAVKNAQDGISLLQTAEGSLTEVHNMLHRMRELAVQSANGTLQPEDRKQIQTEMDNLAKEVTRITNATQFNGMDLIDGS
ncbi:MAG TPA: flagellin, partial [Symbiobacteriaceae bacterium]|nr:flagellin [Symbiobacteriaceae bacterium]